MVAEIEDRLCRFINETVPKLPKESVFFDDLNNPLSLKQIQKLFAHDDYFHELMFDSDFERLASELLNEEVKGVNMQYFNKPPRTSLPTPPHQDGYYFLLDNHQAVTMWLALDPVDETNGAVRYIPGSHKHGLRPHTTTETLGFSQGIGDYSDIDKQSEVLLQLNPGDLLVHHSLTIHRADRNQSDSRNRQAIGFIYYATSARESSEKTQRHDSLMRELAEKGKI